MARLILQMQTSVDGYIASGQGLPWLLWDWTFPSTWSPALLAAFNATFDDVEAVLLSRNMAEGGYIDHWTAMFEAHGSEPGYAFLGRVMQAEKIVVTRRSFEVTWPKTRVLTAPFAEAVQGVKRSYSGTVISFGGVRFSGALLGEGLVDELQTYINPALLGEGHTLARGLPARSLELLASSSFAGGMVVNKFAVIGPESASGM